MKPSARAPRPRRKAAAAPEVVLWAYCVARSPRPPRLRAKKTSVGLGAPRALDLGEGLWLVVSEAPFASFAEEPLNARLKDMEWVTRCAVHHEAVIEEATARAAAVVPMKLFTLFLDEGRARANVTLERRRIEAALDRVAHRTEYGVRLVLDELKARRLAEERAKKVAAGNSGAAFLLRKKSVKEAAFDAVRGGRDAAEELFAGLRALAADARRRHDVEGMAPGSRLLLDAVFLVDAKAQRRFRAEVKTLGRGLTARGFDVTLNGPWPPYHFVADAA